MNIVYIAYSCNPYNGTEDKLGWYISYYASLNNKVTVITKEQGRKAINDFLEKNPSTNLSVEYVEISEIYKKFYNGSFYSGRLNVWNKKAFKVVTKLCETEHVDVIHQINPVEFRSMGPYGNIKGVPFICGPVGGGEYIPTQLKKYINRGAKVEFIRYIANIFYRFKLYALGRINSCDCLLFANEETREFLIQESKRDIYRVMTELGSLNYDINKHQKSEILTIFTGGRLIYRKGFDLLFDAIESVPKEYIFKVNVVGTGPLYEHLMERCKSSIILKQRVTMLGKIPHTEMGKMYQAADVFVLPSLRETTGTVILEALENGIPVIAPNKFGAKIVINDKCGIFYDVSGDMPVKHAIASIIIYCIQNRDKISLMSEECYKRAEELSFENKVKFYQKLYDEITGRILN